MPPCHHTSDQANMTTMKPAGAAVVFPWLLRPAPSLDTIGSGQRKQMAHALRPVPENLHQHLIRLTDTHAHTAGYGEEARASFAKNTKENHGRPDGLYAKEYVVVSVEPSDWKYCREEECPKPAGQEVPAAAVRPALGIHPQCADEIDDPDPSSTGNTWLSDLRISLDASPWSIVGECGLDNNGPYRHAFESHQMPIFRQHLRLAAELNRPMSVHCVKADGALVDMLIKEVAMGHKLPPTVCLHSFSGSIETLKRVINVVEGRPRNKKERLRRTSSEDKEGEVRIFVGFNAWTNLYKKQAPRFANALMNETPMGQCRLLIESDWNPIDFDFEGTDRRDSDKILMNGLIDLSEMLGWEPERTASVLAENTDRFLEPVQ